ncbi:unnamed protein product [Rhizoctonia solani]|uniref:Peptidase C14 caspase domain-containing protein n=1 Tax=Rhizoctonia solani TaxID=456999 RepID=A0A8H3CUB1_9AGAM|nr:unnamed protein product [Rhizoctonia solani]
MNHMDSVRFLFELVLRGYTPYLLGSIILLGLAMIFVLHNPTPREISGDSEQWLPTVTPITDGGGKPQSLSNPTPIQKLYGLVIGIDTYPSLHPLKGAVNDADDVSRCLTFDLGIPANNVVNLRNGEATRKRIIQELQALSNNPNIEHGDPILIYYAGHGGLSEANEEWGGRYGGEQVQVIFPFDYQLKDPESTKLVNCIPDKTIAVLLNELAAKKGDNITVIFDSCHSASGTRANEPGRKDRLERSADVKLEIPHDIDDHLFAPEYSTQFGPKKEKRDAELLLCTDQTSHIHFAACGTRQKAFEQNGRGVFTAALLKKIRESRVDNITYHNLMKSLEMSSEDQSPQCYGKHKSRILFNSRISLRNIEFIRVDFKEGVFVLAAGDASGVTVGSVWELHESPTNDSPSIGQFKVNQLHGSVAVLNPTSHVDKLPEPEGNSTRQLHARCVQVGPGNELKVWISPDDRQLLFRNPEHLGGTDESGTGYVITPTRDAADVALEVDYSGSTPGSTSAQAEVVFCWCDSLAVKYGAERLKHRKPARREEVETVLFAAAKWRWHLRRGNSQGRSPSQEVTMNMLKVGTTVNRLRTFFSEHEPAPMNEDGAAEFVVDNSVLFGFELKSRISSPLYVRMFYFDATDFSIGDMFGHNVANGAGTTNIPPRGQLLIGSGGDGGTPLRFNISPGNQVEIGYMKIFWSTEPLELDHVGQKSAFKMRPGDARGVDLDWEGADSKWGTICLPLVLRERLS